LRQQRVNHAGAGRLDVIVFGLLAEEWQKGGAGRS
jgi:hypothetical protein